MSVPLALGSLETGLQVQTEVSVSVCLKEEEGGAALDYYFIRASSCSRATLSKRTPPPPHTHMYTLPHRYTSVIYFMRCVLSHLLHLCSPLFPTNNKQHGRH